MEKIRVLHIMTGGIHREGISSTQLEFFKNIDMEKFEIYVAAVHNDNYQMIEEFRRIGCTVIVFKDRKKHTIEYFFQLVLKLNKLRPQIVHVHGSSAIMSIELLASKLAHVKVRIAHSRNTKADQVWSDKILRPLFNCLYTYGLACGEDAGKWLFGNKPYTVIHNGKDFEKFKFNESTRQKVRKQLHFEKKKIIGHVGTFNFQKNHEYLIKVFYEYQKKHPEAILYLMGEGPLKSAIEKLADHLEIREKIIFAGSVDNVSERLQAMDIMLFPSKFEGLPNVVLEWQVVGLPSIISNCITKECAPSELVEFESINESPEKWVKKINRMLEKYNNRYSQSDIGIKALKMNGFDIQDATKKLEDIYYSLVVLEN